MSAYFEQFDFYYFSVDFKKLKPALSFLWYLMVFALYGGICGILLYLRYLVVFAVFCGFCDSLWYLLTTVMMILVSDF